MSSTYRLTMPKCIFLNTSMFSQQAGFYTLAFPFSILNIAYCFSVQALIKANKPILKKSCLSEKNPNKKPNQNKIPTPKNPNKAFWVIYGTSSVY